MPHSQSPVFHRKNHRSSPRLERPTPPHGFTIIELMCCIAILALISVLAVPGFSIFLQRLRVNQAVDELKGALYIARSEAVRRGESIKIRKRDSFGSTSCSGSPGDWRCGWLVFIDQNNNSVFDSSGDEPDLLLYSFDPPNHIAIRFTSNMSVLTVNRWGAINGVAASFNIAPQAGNGEASTDPSHNMMLCVSTGGRVRANPGIKCAA